MLAIRRFGSGPPVLALHGFTMHGGQFAGFPLAGFEVIAPDLPGHGGSENPPEDPFETLDIIATAIAPFGSIPVIGYSQGARLALTMACLELISPTALVLVSGTAGITDDAKRHARAQADRARAAELTSIGVEAFVEAWTTSGLTSTTHLGTHARAADRAVRTENSAHGLASALVSYGQGELPPVWDLLDRVNVPTLVITGRNDDVYTTLGVRLSAGIGDNAELVTISEAGHNPLSDQPAATAAIIGGFLRQVSSSGTGDPLDQS